MSAYKIKDTPHFQETKPQNECFYPKGKNERVEENKNKERLKPSKAAFKPSSPFLIQEGWAFSEFQYI